ncbi:response regulator transcription factor [Paraburkholderia hayleyella]|uniref:response regulator transcription factor n=1 Tax=Paraburkholderia hayleyella TaxID=2152889 RepID=UPI0012926059|nr:response regulator transcription factor [Paraburkholderia hayleyella]
MRFSVFHADAERREGLKALLRQIDRQARFTDIHDWHQATRILRRHHTDLLVIDWQEWMSIDDIRQLLKNHPHLPVAVLTDDTSLDNIYLLLKSGIRGVIPRTYDSRLIALTLEIIVRGWRYIPEEALPFSLPKITDKTGQRIDPLGPLSRQIRLIANLSPRQQQILRCVHMGSTNKMIARTLGIAEGTVKVHLSSIFQQLGASNRTAAVANYNGWLAAHLEVLRAEHDGSPRPVMGKPGPVPLRRSTRRPFKYPSTANEAADTPIAAEPVQPFGDTGNNDPEPDNN